MMATDLVSVMLKMFKEGKSTTPAWLMSLDIAGAEWNVSQRWQMTLSINFPKLVGEAMHHLGLMLIDVNYPFPLEIDWFL